ncbi:MAG: hypothetical protein KY459_03720 [Acidobacteria bacterium]|nr:hypothetical protein [Acidobacteriota bacterium]
MAVISLSCAIASPAVAAIPSSERQALLALYDSTDGEIWIDDTNWRGPAGTECTWAGVVCNEGSASLSASVNS